MMPSSLKHAPSFQPRVTLEREVQRTAGLQFIIGAMRFTPKLVLLALTALSIPSLAAAQDARPGRVVLVLPFDNRSGNPTLNWIADSFPDTFNKRLSSSGFLTISQDDRRFAYNHLGLPTNFKPSRATAIRIAQQLDANFVIVGSYNVTGQNIAIQAQVLSVDNLTLSPPVEDGAELARLYDAENATAWKAARAIDPHFNVAESTFLFTPAVPLTALENYIRGSDAPTPEERIKRLTAAVAAAPNYSAALLALGKQQYTARDYTAADATLSRVPASDRLALEANFYLGLARFNSANYAGAEKAFNFVAQSLPLPEVVNDEGVALARQGRDGVAYFQRASAADPNDEDYHYNLSVGLFRRGDLAGALAEANAALKLKPADNEAIALRAHIAAAPAGTHFVSTPNASFNPVERIRRDYSEAGFRQAAFQIDQLRAARMAMLPPAKQASQYDELGTTYFGQGLLPEAEQEFQSALVADSNDQIAHAGLAQIREASGSDKEARSEANLSIRFKPTAPAYLVLARLDLAAKNLPAAAADVSNALRLEPANSAAAALRLNLQQRGQAIP
jgi:tetratricopeptide (TPR) repeat protein/TolB-like protein